MSGFIMSMLNLEVSPEEQKWRTSAFYGAKKHEGRDAKDPMLKLVQNNVGPQRSGFRSSKDYTNYTNCSISKQYPNRFSIIEEEDTSDDF